MDAKKTLILAAGALVANQMHEAHVMSLNVEKMAAAPHPAAEMPLYCCLPHGNHNDLPGSPPIQRTVVHSTASTSVSSSFYTGNLLDLWRTS